MDVRLNVWGIDGRFGRDEFMWEDLEVVELCGPPPFFASSDFIDLNLMKNSVLVTERHSEDGGAKQADNSHR